MARLYTAMGGDDKAVRNGDDDGESGADLELFRQLVAMPPKKCRRAACSSMSLCGVVGIGAACRKEFATKRKRLKDRAT